MVVDYGPSKQVCKIQLPSGMKIVGTVTVGATTKEQVDEVLNEVSHRQSEEKRFTGWRIRWEHLRRS